MYRQLDIDTILKNLDNIENNAMTIKLDKYEPTLTEINSVYKEITNFIKTNNRIVYGGYAQNELIRNKNKDDTFYKVTDLADIEFYTPDPIGDLIDLCDILYKKKYKYVEGKEGVHIETYKIFVNFMNYCDISYMPPDIYKNCPTITVDELRLCHPQFMLIDAYRVYCDPMSSYFRLSKTFTRFTKLMKYYPFNDNMIYNKIDITTSNKEEHDGFLYYIRKKIFQHSKLIIVGTYCFNNLMKIAKMPETYLLEDSFYQVISTEYNNDINYIYQKLLKYNKDIKKKSYNPFYQFVDKSTEFYYNDNLILRVYGANDRCTVYRKSEKKKVLFGTFQLLFLYSLINYNIGIIRGNKFNETLYATMIVRLLKARDTYLENNKITILDKSPFQEFTTECIGEPKDILRESFLERAKKREQGKQISFLYKPKGNPGKKPNFKFDNTSGDLKK